MAKAEAVKAGGAGGGGFKAKFRRKSTDVSFRERPAVDGKRGSLGTAGLLPGQVPESGGGAGGGKKPSGAKAGEFRRRSVDLSFRERVRGALYSSRPARACLCKGFC